MIKQQALDILDEMILTGKNLKERFVIPDANCYTIGDMTEMLEESKSRIQSLPDNEWIELDIAYPNKGIDVICQDEDGTTHYAFQCQCKQPGCREWRDQVTGGGLMINPKRWRLNPTI